MINPSDFNPRVIKLFEKTHQVISERHGSVEITDDEITYSIKLDGEAVLLSRQERAEEPRQLMQATLLEDIERYLIDDIGYEYRSERNLPPIRLPWNPSELEQGFEMTEYSAAGVRGRWFSLTDPLRRGWRVDIRKIGVIEAVRFSHIAKIDLDDLVSSYESSDGSPALQQFLHTD